MNSIVKDIGRSSPLRKKVKPGDTLISINGHNIADVLDYMFYSYDGNLELVVRSPDGKTRSIAVCKEEGDDLGLEFESFLMDASRACTNRCIFCFVDQLPKGLRSTLYFKDDDARLSFLTGNYITLTNLSNYEKQRIIDMKISPINISVHSTNPELRAMMLGNKRGAEGHETMKKLADGGITMNCQIVCCPGINDGEELIRTMRDLVGMYPAVNSVSIVPVGLTEHREGLFTITPYDAVLAAETIDTVDGYGEICLRDHGSRIFFCADELYLKAGRTLPEYSYYEDYPQLENGVGMLRLFESEFLEELDKTGPKDNAGVSFTIATGKAAAPFLEQLLMTAEEKCGSINGKVFPIVNKFFGDGVDVAGLVTGEDLIACLKGRELGDRLLITKNMLRSGEGVFLDDMTIEDLSKELNIQVIPVASHGAAFLRAVLGTE